MNRRSVSDSSHSVRRATAILASGVLAITGLQAGSAGNESRLSSEVSSALEELGREKSSALVRIHCRDEAGEISGTGFLIDPSGTVCTLTDYVRGGNGLVVENGGKSASATLLLSDERTGISFLKTSLGASSFIPPFPSASITLNAPVTALAEATSDEGARSHALLGITRNRIDHDGERFFPVPLLTALLPSTGSRPGTPVFDLSGKFAGIVLRSGLKDDSCAILPAAAVEKLHGDLLRFGRVNPGWIGAVVEEAAVPEGTSRTRIAAVEPGSPAEKAGIRPGDTLLAIGNRSIVMPQEVLESSFYLTAGQEVRLMLSRSGEIKRISLRCAAVPSATALTQQ